MHFLFEFSKKTLFHHFIIAPKTKDSNDSSSVEERKVIKIQWSDKKTINLYNDKYVNIKRDIFKSKYWDQYATM